LQENVDSLKRQRLLFETSVTACAEWDSESALSSSDLSQIRDVVPKKAENAFHVVALHEVRSDFQPVLWRDRELREDGTESNVKQCLFFGCHSDVGGGNADPGLATVSLLWVVSQVASACSAEFDETTLLSFWVPTVTEIRRLGLQGRYTTQHLDLKDMGCHVFTKGDQEKCPNPHRAQELISLRRQG
jgi:hypothetical protein